MDDRLKEKIEVLDGSRRKTTRRAAVRIEDVEALLQVRTKLKAVKAAGANPTGAEFDALLDDVEAILLRLVAVADALQKRIL